MIRLEKIVMNGSFSNSFRRLFFARISYASVAWSPRLSCCRMIWPQERRMRMMMNRLEHWLVLMKPSDSGQILRSSRLLGLHFRRNLISRWVANWKRASFWRFCHCREVYSCFIKLRNCVSSIWVHKGEWPWEIFFWNIVTNCSTSTARMLYQAAFSANGLNWISRDTKKITSKCWASLQG